MTAVASVCVSPKALAAEYRRVCADWGYESGAAMAQAYKNLTGPADAEVSDDVVDEIVAQAAQIARAAA